VCFGPTQQELFPKRCFGYSQIQIFVVHLSSFPQMARVLLSIAPRFFCFSFWFAAPPPIKMQPDLVSLFIVLLEASPRKSLFFVQPPPPAGGGSSLKDTSFTTVFTHPAYRLTYLTHHLLL